MTVYKLSDRAHNMLDAMSAGTMFMVQDLAIDAENARAAFELVAHGYVEVGRELPGLPETLIMLETGDAYIEAALGKSVTKAG